MGRTQAVLGIVGWELGLYLLSLWYLQHMAWGPREVIWSLWASSLLVGSITLLLGIARKCFFWVGPALRGERRRDFDVKPRHVLLLVAGSSGVGLFLIAFFSVHFGLFHAVHSIFLNGFFPLVENRSAAGNLPAILVENFLACVDAFPAFIAACVAASVPGWLRGDFLDAAMTAPYATVMKLHFTIIAIGFADAAGLQAAAMIVFLAVYFLPLRTVFDAVRASRPSHQSNPMTDTHVTGDSHD